MLKMHSFLQFLFYNNPELKAYPNVDFIQPAKEEIVSQDNAIIDDLVKKKFYKKALGTYKQLSKYNKEDGSDISAYKLFLKNLEMSREVYNDVSSSDVYREFVKAKDINNVIRVLTFEKKFMDEKFYY